MPTASTLKPPSKIVNKPLPQPEPDANPIDSVINSIAKDLMAQGLNQEDIVMPGSAAREILYISDDFDEPISDFADYS